MQASVVASEWCILSEVVGRVLAGVKSDGTASRDVVTSVGSIEAAASVRTTASRAIPAGKWV